MEAIDAVNLVVGVDYEGDAVQTLSTVCADETLRMEGLPARSQDLVHYRLLTHCTFIQRRLRNIIIHVLLQLGLSEFDNPHRGYLMVRHIG